MITRILRARLAADLASTTVGFQQPQQSHEEGPLQGAISGCRKRDRSPSVASSLESDPGVQDVSDSQLPAAHAVSDLPPTPSVSPVTILTPPDGRFYWSGIIRTALADRFDRVERLGMQPVMLDSSCSGLGAEFWCIDGLGVPTDDQCTASEIRADTAAILLGKKGKHILHLFPTLRDQITGRGQCLLTGGKVEQRRVDFSRGAVPPALRRHLWVVGPPCQPYSYVSAENKALGCAAHPGYSVIFGGNRSY